MTGVDGEITDRQVDEIPRTARFQQGIERGQRIVLRSAVAGLVQFIEHHHRVGQWLVGQQLKELAWLGVAPEGFGTCERRTRLRARHIEYTKGQIQLIGQPACRLGFADARRADQQHGRPGYAAIAQAGEGKVVT